MMFSRYVLLLLLLVSCDGTQADKLAGYKLQLASYDCSALRNEAAFQEKLVAKLVGVRDQSSVAQDVAVGILNLGVGNMVLQTPVSGKAEYVDRIAVIKQKQQLINQSLQERCSS